MNKDVTGEQRQLDLRAAVLPTVGGLIQRQVRFHALLRKLLGDYFFVSWKGVRSVPTWCRCNGRKRCGRDLLTQHLRLARRFRVGLRHCGLHDPSESGISRDTSTSAGDNTS